MAVDPKYYAHNLAFLFCCSLVRLFLTLSIMITSLALDIYCYIINLLYSYIQDGNTQLFIFYQKLNITAKPVYGYGFSSKSRDTKECSLMLYMMKMVHL